MEGSKLMFVDFSKEDYKALGHTALHSLKTNWSLDCDYKDYWLARALRDRFDLVPWLQMARCASGQALGGVPLRRFTRRVTAAGCPERCDCRESPEHTEVRCIHAGLRVLPRLGRLSRDLPPLTALSVADNEIATLDATDVASLPDDAFLDLSRNQISTFDAETVRALFAGNRTVALADNPLRCDCDAIALLRAVAGKPWRVDEDAHCADNETLGAAAERAVVACASAPLTVGPVAALLLVLLLPTALVAAALAQPTLRARLKLLLLERGVCPTWLTRADAADDASRPYDAFVSFSHRDASYAARLVARLEGAGRRVCLHERDWTPGEWIPTQIARSVRAARRTVVLVSEHFLGSEWARAELREAYGAALGEARPRLLVVLLPGCAPAAAAAAAPELRAYLAAVTYLRWDDPRFWPRLQAALPARVYSPTRLAY